MKERWIIINCDTGNNEILFSCLATSEEDCFKQLEANPPPYYHKHHCFDCIIDCISISSIQKLLDLFK